MNYTDFITELIQVILSDPGNSGMDITDISLSEDSIRPHWEAGITPRHLFEVIWEKDAGNYWAF